MDDIQEPGEIVETSVYLDGGRTSGLEEDDLTLDELAADNEVGLGVTEDNAKLTDVQSDLDDNHGWLEAWVDSVIERHNRRKEAVIGTVKKAGSFIRNLIHRPRSGDVTREDIFQLTRAVNGLANAIQLHRSNQHSQSLTILSRSNLMRTIDRLASGIERLANDKSQVQANTEFVCPAPTIPSPTVPEVPVQAAPVAPTVSAPTVSAATAPAADLVDQLPPAGTYQKSTLSDVA